MWFCLAVLLIVINFLINTLSCFECGVRKLNINLVIVHGQPTSPGEWPWHVAVYHRSGVSDSYACGGTLISEIFVLTADHCVKGDNGFVLSKRRMFVRVGIHNFQEPDPRTFQQHGIQQIHQFAASAKLKNDIALLELSTKVLFTNYVQPACVNQEEDLTKQYGTAIGWGFTEYDEESPVLKSSQMPVVSTIQCLESNDGVFRLVLDSSNFCAGYLNGTTVCNGDSGGGLHFDRNGVWYIGGIISFTAPRDSSNKCHTKSYAGFTNIYRFIPWIKAVTGLQYLKIPSILPQDCGKYLVNRIVRGSTAKLYEFPWMAEVIGKNGTLYFTSTHGSLIHTRYVLTNVPLLKSDFVRLGEYNRRDIECQNVNQTDCAPPTQDIKIENIINHPGFNNYTYQNNIALIRLAKDATLNDHTQPICLPTTGVVPPQFVITGWGAVNLDVKFSVILQKATIPIISLSECKMVVRNSKSPQYYVGEGVICAGSAGTPNTCTGDSGIPLGYPLRYSDKRVRFVQYGISSVMWCGYGPSIYTDVTYYMDWILTNVKL